MTFVEHNNRKKANHQVSTVPKKLLPLSDSVGRSGSHDILLGRRATQCRKRICEWNKWKGHPDSLRADIESAYNAQPSTVTEDSPAVSPSGDLETVPPTAWDMAIGKSDVSNSKDMYSILKDLKIIAKETGCAVMFIHHTRKRVFERGESIQLHHEPGCTC